MEVLYGSVLIAGISGVFFALLDFFESSDAFFAAFFAFAFVAFAFVAFAFFVSVLLLAIFSSLSLLLPPIISSEVIEVIFLLPAIFFVTSVSFFLLTCNSSCFFCTAGWKPFSDPRPSVFITPDSFTSPLMNAFPKSFGSNDGTSTRGFFLTRP